MHHFFLRSKAYVIFALIIIPVLLSYYFQFLYLNWIQELQTQLINTPDAPPPVNFGQLGEYKIYVLLYLAILAISSFTQLGYWHTVSTQLSKYLPTGTNLKPRRFKIASIVAALYVVGLLFFIYFSFEWMVELGKMIDEAIVSGDEPDFLSNENMLIGIVMSVGVGFLCGLLGVVAMIYCAYYTGKTLRCIELQKPQQGSAILGYVVLAYFLMIGIWIFQPKIHRLLDTGEMADKQISSWE